jgi:ribonuclease VapC
MGPKASSPERALILDSSAILAAMLAEPSAGQVLEKLDAAFSIGIAAPTLVEAAIVLSSKLGKDARPRLNEFLREAEAEILPFGPGHVDAAVDAFLKYGKGRHPAGLNFGDCLTYAAAAVAGLPLLFTGNDFGKTDIEAA